MDQVVCIRDDWVKSHEYEWPTCPIKDIVYTIAAVHDCSFGEAYELAEIGPVNGKRFCWRADHFRPITKKTDIGIFTRMLKTKKLEDA
jgi:hypothetical protein